MSNNVTKLQAFKAFKEFLQYYYEENLSDDICDLLTGTSMDIWVDGGTADPAYWGEWIDGMDKVLAKDQRDTVPNQDSLTQHQAFEVAKVFLKKYYAQTRSEDIKIVLQDMQPDSDAYQITWDIWIKSIARSM